MDYSSLILMERDNETGFVSKEVGSFQVSEGAEFVKNFYVKGDTVYFIFDTKEDVEEWQYSAIYDLFDYISGPPRDGGVTKAQVITLALEALGLEKEDVLMVGDTVNDEKGAEGAGVDFIPVTWGFGFNK